MTKFVLPALFATATICASGQTVPIGGAPTQPAQEAPEQVRKSTPDDKVVAKLKDGKEFTAGEIRRLIAQYPPEVRRSFEQNPVRTLNMLLMMQKLARQAQADGLDKKPEFTDGEAFNHWNTLARAEVARERASYSPTSEEEQKFYESHPDRWEQAEFKAIYISFSNAPVPAKPLNAEEAAKEALAKSHPALKPSDSAPGKRTEAEAKARVLEIRRQLVAGADFGKLAAQYSDDKTSAAKGGDFGTAGRYSPYPEALKKALFALKPGQVSEPLREPSGYYILKLDSISKQPLSEVRSVIRQELLRDHISNWVKSIEARYNVDVVDAQYFAGRPPR